MKKIQKADFKNYILLAGTNTANRVYPLSISEGFQPGEIFVNEGPVVLSALFWHYCGFGYISGSPTPDFLKDVYAAMLANENRRRLLLITDDENVIRFFEGKNVQMSARVEYAYRKPEQSSPVCSNRMPEDGSVNHKQENRILTCGDKFRIVKIAEDNISKIRGRIIPSFSWADSLHFLENGFGYLALEGETACAVAFSAAVSTEEVDIGVETREEYRGNGLASALAGKMCEHITGIGKKPVWAHAAANKASMKTARRCGFVEVKRNTVIRLYGDVF